MLPLWLKIFIGLALAAEFIVITQWDRLTAMRSSISAPRAIAPPQKAVQHFDFPQMPAADKSKTSEIQAALSKRMERMVISNPKVEPSGTIIANGQTLYLYGIKPFDSRQLCTKASGERWACGLHAYADLRNSIAQKTIICDPKSIVPNGVIATCRLGESDIAAKLVRDGLAEMSDGVTDASLLSAQTLAKSQKLGIWDR